MNSHYGFRITYRTYDSPGAPVHPFPRLDLHAVAWSVKVHVLHHGTMGPGVSPQVLGQWIVFLFNILAGNHR